MRIRIVSVSVLLAVAAAGCGGDPASSPAATGSPSTTASPSSSPTAGSPGAFALPARDRAAALEAASTGLSTLLSYDYRTLDQTATEAARRMTGAMASTFTQTFDLTKQAVLTKKAVVTATVAAIGACGAEKTALHVLAFVNQSTRTAGGAPQVSPQIVNVEMVLQDGRWLIDKLSANGACDATEADAGRAEVLATALRFETAFDGLNYQDMDGWSARVEALSTGDLLTQLKKSAEQTKAATIEKKLTAVTQTASAALASYLRSSATVLVTARVERTTDGQNVAPVTFRFKATLSRVDGQWLVSSFSSVA